ncbi:hypothetical protein H663_020390 [Limnohabitans planktonicus II-D5]|uniref:Uncharacterized protein n=1 Tax=Limnohabitans planktonicus II-D5 TaxID=1293045 RepID=A0A2T7SRS7_9BURK|nr:hypothetical protein H663_020390 [Limnohabitans planktonicus II-D5]
MAARSLSLRVVMYIKQLRLSVPLNMVVKLSMVFGFIETFSTDSLPHLKTYNFEEIMTAMSFSIDSGR